MKVKSEEFSLNSEEFFNENMRKMFQILEKFEELLRFEVENKFKYFLPN